MVCGEIKASEGEEMIDGIHWIYSEENGEVIEAYCKGKLFYYIGGLNHPSTASLNSPFGLYISRVVSSDF